MIMKVKGGYKAASSKGRQLSKRPKSKKEAIQQLVAVEYSKAKRMGMKKPSKAQMDSAMGE